MAKLSKFTDFTPAQAASVLLAAPTNNQVGWIATDADVNTFLQSVLDNHCKGVDPKLVAEVVELLHVDTEPDGYDLDDPPF